MSRTCQFIRELVLDIDWLDHEDRTVLQDHLSRCPDCSDELDLVQRLGSLLDEDAVAQMPADMTERIMRAVAADRAPVRHPSTGAVFLVVVAVQVLALVWLRGGLTGMIEQFATFARGLSDGFLVPLFAAAADTLTGLALSAGRSWSLIPSSLWLPAAACMVVLCLCSGGILYSEERNHD